MFIIKYDAKMFQATVFWYWAMIIETEKLRSCGFQTLQLTYKNWENMHSAGL